MQATMRKNKTYCSICNKPYEGHGHLAHPINDGYCCDECHKLVMLARFKSAKGFYGGYLNEINYKILSEKKL